jgi:hypothetical protein
LINADIGARVFLKLIVRVFKFTDLKREHSEFHGSPAKARALAKCFEFKIPGCPGLLEGVEQDVRLLEGSSSLNPNNTDNAQDFNGNNGNSDNDNRDNNNSVRCVGR